MLVIGFLFISSYVVGELKLYIKIPAFIIMILFVLFIYKERIPQIKQILKVPSKKTDAATETENA